MARRPNYSWDKRQREMKKKKKKEEKAARKRSPLDSSDPGYDGSSADARPADATDDTAG